MDKPRRTLTGAQIVIETLIEQGVSTVFGYPGGAVLNIYDALYLAENRIRHVLTAHEQGAAHAADGYARVTGEVGVVIGTSGPGATNLVTGIATAMLDSIPMVAITGNVPNAMIGRDSFQEINITGVTMPITKHNYLVSRVEELADTIREAFQIAKSGRPGPVLIDIPKDVQIGECDFVPQGVIPPWPQNKAPEEDIARAVDMINASQRPYIYIGGGAAGIGLGEEVIALAEKLDACIGCSLMGISTVPSDHPRFLGMQGMHGHYASSMANKEADLIIGIGVRFSDRATGNTAKYARDAKIVQLDSDLSEINKNVSTNVGLIGDIAWSLTQILERCDRGRRDQWRDRIAALKARETQICRAEDLNNPAPLTPRMLLNVINLAKEAGTVIATDVGQHQMWTAQYAAFERPRRFCSSGGLGTMGYGLGAAIGAQLGSGERVILVTGDGSFGMNLNEMATAVSYNLPIVIVVVNNGVLGMVRQWQTLFYEKRYSNTVLDRRTDFVRLAEAFGASACRVTTEAEFREAMKRAMTCAGPFLIDAVIDRDEFVLPMLPPGGSVEDMIMTRREAGL